MAKAAFSALLHRHQREQKDALLHKLDVSDPTKLFRLVRMELLLSQSQSYMLTVLCMKVMSYHVSARYFKSVASGL